MQNPDISSLIETILKPLKFASKDGFARLSSVKGLEGLMEHLMERLFTDPALKDHARASGLTELKRLFIGFDSLDTPSKKEKIQRAFSIIDSITAGPSPETVRITPEEAAKRLKALKTPLQYVKGIGPKLSE